MGKSWQSDICGWRWVRCDHSLQTENPKHGTPTVKHEKTKFSRSRSVTDEGKVISSQNPFKTGCHSAEIKQNQAYLRQLIKNFSEFF
jgi:hypothetical protein